MDRYEKYDKHETSCFFTEEAIKKFEKMRKEYYQSIDNNPNIPQLKVGQIWRGIRTGKIGITYINKEVNRIGLKPIERTYESIFDTHLDMIEWDLMELLENEEEKANEK